MKTILNLDELFLDQLSNLYSGQVMLKSYLGKFNDKISSPDLAELMIRYKSKTTEQLTGLEIIFNRLNKTPENDRNPIMKSLLDGALEAIMKNSYSEFIDVSIIRSLQEICHHKVAGYRSAYIYANALGYEYISRHIYSNIFEEKKMDKELSSAAIKKIKTGISAPLFI